MGEVLEHLFEGLQELGNSLVAGEAAHKANDGYIAGNAQAGAHRIRFGFGMRRESPHVHSTAAAIADNAQLALRRQPQLQSVGTQALAVAHHQMTAGRGNALTDLQNPALQAGRSFKPESA